MLFDCRAFEERIRVLPILLVFNQSEAQRGKKKPEIGSLQSTFSPAAAGTAITGIARSENDIKTPDPTYPDNGRS